MLSLSIRFLERVIPEYLSHLAHDPRAQAALGELFQRLVSSRQINLTDYRKQNCRIFAENMSDFLNAC
jgi:hypothetical protein